MNSLVLWYLATFLSNSISLDSDPKTNFFTPNSFNSSRDEDAKISLELLPNTKGSSITISTPCFKASLVFSSLVSIEGIPLS